MAATYKVLTITELSRLNDTGGLERYYRHKIRTKGGVVLTVDIDEDMFTSEKAPAMLTAKAAEADKILTS